MTLQRNNADVGIAEDAVEDAGEDAVEKGDAGDKGDAGIRASGQGKRTTKRSTTKRGITKRGADPTSTPMAKRSKCVEIKRRL